MRFANRRYRRQLARKIKEEPSRTLRVFGSESTGFRLLDEDSLIVLGPVGGFPKQKEAVRYGQERFGQTAKKLLKVG